MSEQEFNSLTEKVIGAAIEVHKELGPGLLESVYEQCLVRELTNAGLRATAQMQLPIVYKGERLDKDFFIDVLVNDKVVLELKAVEKILPLHEAQLLSYLRLADKKLGLIINFNVTLLKKGIRRVINGHL